MNSNGKTILFLAFYLMLCCMKLEASDPRNEMNTKASQLYQEGKYDESLHLWYEIAKNGNTDPNLYFNIGSAEAIQNHVPESILAYEKALRLKPGDHEIIEAIKKERGKIENAVIPVSPFFLIEWYRMFLGLMRPGYWGLTGLLLLLTALVQWLKSIQAFTKFDFIPGKNILIFLVSGILCIVFGFISFRQLHRSDEAIVLSVCDCRQAPSEESPLTRTLYAGEKVRITDHIAEWKRVSLLNLDEGWIKQDCIKAIEIGK